MATSAADGRITTTIRTRPTSRAARAAAGHTTIDTAAWGNSYTSLLSRVYRTLFL